MASGTACGATFARGRGRCRLGWRVGSRRDTGVVHRPVARPDLPTRLLDTVRLLSYYRHMATKTDKISLRLGPQLREELEQAAHYQEMRLGEFVRYALSEYLRLQKDAAA